MQIKIFGKTIFETKGSNQVESATADNKIQAYSSSFFPGTYSPVFYRPFDGEKSMGGVGPINRYMLDHDALRLRSWQLLLESEIVQIGISRYVMWLIGGGLKLRCEPLKSVLEKKGIKIETQKFSKDIEALFELYANSPVSDYAGMETLHTKIYEAEINALVGGDCLFIININDDGLPVVTLKDVAHVQTPLFKTVPDGIYQMNPDTGNIVRHGVEIDAKGQHVAYWVKKGNNYTNTLADWNNYERIPARDPSTGFVRCFMYYGLRYRLDDIRGIPLITVCMETTKQLELYKEATVAGAVERAKIAIVAEHELGANGGNVFDSNVVKATGGPYSDIPVDSSGQAFGNTVAATTGKQFINGLPGMKLKSIEGKQEVHFSEFYDTNMTVIFAAIGIPKEIALMLFGSNYSASRASIKDWEHTLIVKRKKNVSPALKHIYNMFFLTQVLQNEISAPGYLEACGIYPGKKSIWVKLAYENTAWLGDNPPNIDEYKEVMAARLKAGQGSIHLPFDTWQNIMTDLGITGDPEHTLEEYQDIMQFADEIGIEKVEQKGMVVEDFGDDAEDKPKKRGGEPKKGNPKGNPPKKNKVQK